MRPWNFLWMKFDSHGFSLDMLMNYAAALKRGEVDVVADRQLNDEEIVPIKRRVQGFWNEGALVYGTVYNETGVPDGPLHALTDLKIEEVENQKPKVSLRQKSYRYGALVHKIFVEDVRQDVDWMGRLSA